MREQILTALIMIPFFAILLTSLGLAIGSTTLAWFGGMLIVAPLSTIAGMAIEDIIKEN